MLLVRMISILYFEALDFYSGNHVDSIFSKFSFCFWLAFFVLQFDRSNIEENESVKKMKKRRKRSKLKKKKKEKG